MRVLLHSLEIIGILTLVLGGVSALFRAVEPTAPPTYAPRPPVGPDESGAILDTDPEPANRP